MNGKWSHSHYATARRDTCNRLYRLRHLVHLDVSQQTEPVGARDEPKRAVCTCGIVEMYSQSHNFLERGGWRVGVAYIAFNRPGTPPAHFASFHER